MKKVINLVIALTMCFVIKAHSQNGQWTQEEINKVNQEIEWISEEVSVDEQQRELLKTILLEKNEMLKRGIRTQWGKKIALGRIEDVIRYGMIINRHPGQENIHLVTVRLSEEEFTEKVSNNEDLLNKLNLKKK